MGQITNLQTLRNSDFTLNLGDTNFNLYIKFYSFLKNLKRSLEIKNIYFLFSNVDFFNNNLCINLNLFYSIKKTNLYRFKKKSKFLLKSNFNKNSFKVLLLNLFSFLKINLISFNINIINKVLDRKLLLNYYVSLKIFINTIFLRRFNLFVDFIKISSLFAIKKLNINTVLYFLGNIFKNLSKRKHNQFLVFITFFFNLLIKSSKLKGLKFIISGRLQSKMRASSSKIIVGSVPLQSLDKNISYSKISIGTLYGVFGIKLWSCF
jgi:hypothetical protein